MKTRTAYFLLILLCSLLYLPGISTLPIMDRDESHFAQATRQMMESGNYFTTQYLTITRHQKSPGINWLQAASVDIFSNPESTQIWPYRLPSFLGGLASILLLFTFGKNIFDGKTAFLACGLLASCALLILEAHVAVIDACLLATVIAMQGALWKMYLDHHNKLKIHIALPLIFWLAMSAGFLLKGLPLLMAFLTILTLSIFDRNIRWIKSLNPVFGLSLFIFTTLLWVIPANDANHGNYLLQLFHHDLLPKLSSGVELHGEPPGYYMAIFPLLFFPGSLFVGFAIFWAWKNKYKREERFLLAWIIPTWLFFALMPTKLPQYMLPLYPALALLSARGMLHISWKNSTTFFKGFQYFQLVLWLIIGIGLALAPYFLGHLIQNATPKIAMLSALLLLLSLTIAILFFYQGRYATCIFTSILGLIANFGILSQWIMPQMHHFWLSQTIMHAIHDQANTLISKKSPLIIVDYDEPSLAFYLGTQKIRPAPMNLNNIKNRSSVILIPKEKLNIINNSSYKIITSASAYNYSLGKWSTYYLVQMRPYEQA